MAASGIWANGRKLWIRNLYVLIIGFAAVWFETLGKRQSFCLSYSISVMQNTAVLFKDSSWISISEFIQVFLAKVAAMGPLKAVLRWSGMGNAHGRAACPFTCSLQLLVACVGPWHQLLPQTDISTFHFPYTSPGICPSPVCSLINIMIKNIMVINYNTKQLLVPNWLNFYGPAPEAHILGIPAYCDSSFKTTRDRNINPVKLLLIQNFISPVCCYL